MWLDFKSLWKNSVPFQISVVTVVVGGLMLAMNADSSATKSDPNSSGSQNGNPPAQNSLTPSGQNNQTNVSPAPAAPDPNDPVGSGLNMMQGTANNALNRVGRGRPIP